MNMNYEQLFATWAQTVNLARDTLNNPVVDQARLYRLQNQARSIENVLVLVEENA